MKKVIYLMTLSLIFFYGCSKEDSIFLDSSQEGLKFQSASITLEKSQSRIAPKFPFKGSYVTTVEALSPPPMLSQRITGYGQATHLGNSMFVALPTVNLTTPPPFQIIGTAIFTAANGDEFNTEYTGTSTPNGDGTSTAVLYHDIVSGTGRFANASGSIVANTLINPALPSGLITYEGNISY